MKAGNKKWFVYGALIVVIGVVAVIAALRLSDKKPSVGMEGVTEPPPTEEAQSVHPEEMPDKTIAITMDAAKVGEPVSELIYGQFLEHLERGIYESLWAELLRDRKFFFSVGLTDSPWETIGEASPVRMAKDDPFVGEHTPVISAGEGTADGFRQGAIVLEGNKSYSGYIYLQSETPGAAVELSLVWGEEASERQTVALSGSWDLYEKLPFSFTAAEAAEGGYLEVAAKEGTVRVGTISLMPADNVNGMRPDVLELLKGLDAPIYRWPGGNFVSGYDWWHGVGDRDKRPPIRNLAWASTGVDSVTIANLGFDSVIEPNDVGTDEIMWLMEWLGSEANIAVNTGLGSVQDAADWVEYVNGSTDTPMGAQRAANGHAEPYGVKVWAVGNEMFGDWQLGHMPLEPYIVKHNETAEAMRQVDPSIELIAVGETDKNWSRGMLEQSAEHMDLISEHFYVRQREQVVDNMAAIRDFVRHKLSVHREYRNELSSLRGKDIRVTADEYAYMEPKTPPRLMDALGVAATLNEFIRNSDLVYMANYSMTINAIQGQIKTTPTEAFYQASALPLVLYRAHFGEHPVQVSGNMDALDIAAAWNDDRTALTLAVVNPLEESVGIRLDVRNAKLGGEGQVWRVEGEDPHDYNEPGKPPVVAITEQEAVKDVAGLTVPPYSLSLFRLTAETIQQ